MEGVQPALIAQDLRTIRQRLLASNCFDSTLQQLMTQLDTFNRNEQLVEDWALGAAAQMDALAVRVGELEQSDAQQKIRIADLEAELATVRAKLAEYEGGDLEASERPAVDDEAAAKVSPIRPLKDEPPSPTEGGS